MGLFKTKSSNTAAAAPAPVAPNVPSRYENTTFKMDKYGIRILDADGNVLVSREHSKANPTGETLVYRR